MFMTCLTNEQVIFEEKDLSFLHERSKTRELGYKMCGEERVAQRQKQVLDGCAPLKFLI